MSKQYDIRNLLAARSSNAVRRLPSTQTTSPEPRGPAINRSSSAGSSSVAHRDSVFDFHSSDDEKEAKGREAGGGTGDDDRKNRTWVPASAEFMERLKKV